MDIKPTHFELNHLKLHQPGCSGYKDSVPDHPILSNFSKYHFILKQHLSLNGVGFMQIV